MGNSVSKHRKQSVPAISSESIASSSIVGSSIENQFQNPLLSASSPPPTPIYAAGTSLSVVGVVEHEDGHEKVVFYATRIGIPNALITKDLYSKITVCTLNNIHLTAFPPEIACLRQLVNLEMIQNGSVVVNYL